MKKSIKLIFIFLAVAIAGGLILWQLNKKRIVRHQIEKAVAKGTDSTYYVHYDSSRINAVAGNAVFYNVVLQSDSLQQQLYADDTTKVPASIFNVHIERITILGANIPSFLQKNTIEANNIEILRPVVTIINTGKDEPAKLTTADTLALYKKIIGRFNSIKAGQIKIIDGTIAFARGKKSPHTTLQGVSLDLKNFKIDSSRNYDNLISYFVKDLIATVKSVNVKNEKKERHFSFEGLEYNAPGRFIKLTRFTQRTLAQNRLMIDLRNTRVAGISTNAFIFNNLLKADSLTTDGGMLALYKSQKKANATEIIEIDNDFFDVAFVKNIHLGSTDFLLYNKADKKAKPLQLKNFKFNASDIDSIYSGTNIMRLVGNSNWNLSADGISFINEDKIYKIAIGPFLLDNAHSVVAAKYVSVTPTVSQEKFVQSLKFQKDLYNLRFNNIKLTGADVKKLVTDKMIIAEELSFQPLINIFNDRTVMPDTASKIGQYPQQDLQKMKTAIYIKKVRANNGFVLYKERGALSKKTGDVSFNNINATLTNLTNIDSYKKKNAMMVMTAKCKFLNMADISSEWKISLNSPNGSFNITGNVSAFNGTQLNPVIEPLGMGSIKKGNIQSFIFTLAGDDLKAQGSAVLLYDDLKIKLLKNTGDSNNLKKKGVTSFVANILIKDKNPSAGVTRKGKIAFGRSVTKSFFNLVWKSIFAGAKKSIL